MSNSSSVSNLRQYRFKKDSIKASPTNADSECKLMPGRKRIHAPASSSSDEGPPSPNKQSTLSIKEKEARLIALRQAEPDYDTMVCQDALYHNNWDVDIATKHLHEKCKKKTRPEGAKKNSISMTAMVAAPTTTTPLTANGIRTTTTSLTPTSSSSSSITSSTMTSLHQKLTLTGNGSTKIVDQQQSQQNHHRQQPPVKKFKKKRNDSENSEADDDDDGGDANSRPQDRVYNSDDEEDSDFEQQAVTYTMTKDRRAVFDFMNQAKPNEFVSIRGCTSRKIDVIVELRPFTSWVNMIQKMQSQKHLSTDLLNACQDFLTRRNNMVRIMKKCTRIVERLEAAVAVGGGLCQQPSNLNPAYKLADYQLIGLNWLAVMHNEAMNGILADEMGLGKTIQVIAFVAYLKESGRATGTHLIVVPSSTLENWMQEFARWCPEIRVDKYYGAAEDRRAMRIKYAKSKFAGVDVLLTTYHTVGSTPEERKMFRISKIQYVIFDEAHMLKNMTTQRYATLSRINADRRLLLTGTPLQNNLLELMSLLCFVMPSMFASNTDDIKTLFQKNKQIKGEEETSTFEQIQIEQAKRIMKPFVLRRLKSNVLNSLPPKTDVTLKVALTSRQKVMYKELVQSHSSESGIVRASYEQSGISIMMEMRKLANHPLLLRFYYSDEMVHEIARRLSTHPLYKKNPHPQYIFEELAVLSDIQLYQTLEKYNIKGMEIPDKLILESGKFKQLDELLPKMKVDGHRVLIFSQFTMMLDILERYLDIREYGFLRLDGQTAVTDRQDLIDKYMADSELFVFLLSTRAGGLGINLTAADTVIIHDIDFNPYNDKQAEDRCHRMGQKRPVTIYRMLGEGTIEEGMRVVAQGKLNLEREVTNEADSSVKEHKCMIRILAMALGISDEQKTEQMLSPSPIKVHKSDTNADIDD